MITRRTAWKCRRWVTAALATLSILAAALPASAETPSWIPMEDDGEIGRRQYPELVPATLVLPDLRTLPPTAISLIVEESSGRKSLRFSNAVWNAGPGVLELHGDYDAESGTVSVRQIVIREDGSVLARPAGEFEYHGEHQHVHWDAFAQYQIWSARPDGSLIEERASSDKVGYCLRDIALYISANKSDDVSNLIDVPSQPGFTSCYWRRQGISVGWYDIYYSYTGGQSLDISDLPDGIYALLSTTDPAQILREADETNNTAVIYFSLQGDQISLLETLNGRSQP